LPILNRIIAPDCDALIVLLSDSIVGHVEQQITEPHVECGQHVEVEAGATPLWIEAATHGEDRIPQWLSLQPPRWIPPQQPLVNVLANPPADENRPISIMLLDFQMPKKNGLDVVTHVRHLYSEHNQTAAHKLLLP